ncbi:hypothetical protein LVD15_07715 [Fulvivirga maritima]|uniref:hypothetical protein n=1 Tax=Fulvivirga maritima TaxID=2904247 RepID=UPI001F1DD53F|nr:hypothetical protein [Fulvivirga maritima]UII28304.1 hypothetical protein LVD15_07715 [Fulvivirga maritima]
MDKIKEAFLLGDYELGIDHEKSVVKVEGKKIIDLTIKASEKVFNELCETEDFEFDYALYSPEFYARQVELNEHGEILINEENQYDYDIALYFMEHNEVNVVLTVNEEWITLKGTTEVSGKKYPLEINVKQQS